jgi:hypothetical protein
MTDQNQLIEKLSAPGQSTSEYQVMQQGAFWGKAMAVIGTIIAVGPDLISQLLSVASVLPPSVQNLKWVGLTITVLGLIKSYLIKAKYIESRSDVKQILAQMSPALGRATRVLTPPAEPPTETVSQPKEVKVDPAIGGAIVGAVILALAILFVPGAAHAQSIDPQPPVVSEKPEYPFGGSTRIGKLEIAFHPVVTATGVALFDLKKAGAFSVGALSGVRYAIETNPRYWYALQLAFGAEFLAGDQQRAVFSGIFTFAHILHAGYVIEMGSEHRSSIAIGIGPSVSL